MYLEKTRQALVYGVRPSRTFREAATKYLIENQHKSSIQDEACNLRLLDPYIGNLQLEQVHMKTLQPFIFARKQSGRKTKTINLALGTVRRILNLTVSEWLDEYGLSWLASAPKIKLMPIQDNRQPYPLAWEEQELLFNCLPEHLRDMALFKVNTGTREQEVCRLEWEWEIPVPELETSIFVVPGRLVKNRDDRVIVLNTIAKEVIDKQRGKHNRFVFTYQNKPLSKINNSAWKNARKKAGLVQVRVHDLKHTFGRRLRSAGVSFEDRQDLLGHRSGRITTHYSAAEFQNLLAAACKACDRSKQGVGLLLKNRMKQVEAEISNPRKIPANDFEGCVQKEAISS